MTDPPFASLILDVGSASADRVQRSVASVLDQELSSWELLLHGDGDNPDPVTDARVRVLEVDGPPEVRVRAALEAATGEFVTVMSAGQMLTTDALAILAANVGAETDLAYADERVLDESGDEIEIVRKPVWSPERLLGHFWLGRPVLLRTTLAAQVSSSEPLGEAWEHDLVLRVSALARGIERVAHPLLGGPRRAPDTSSATTAAVRAHVKRLGVRAEVEPGEVAGTVRVRRTLPDDLSVAVVVAFQSRRGLAWGERRWFAVEAVRSMLQHGGHDNLEIVVVHHRTLEASVLDTLLALDERVRLVSVPGIPDRPEMVNSGVLQTNADIVVLMDEHIEVESDGFLTELVGPLIDKGVGLTGPRVLASNGKLVHAGLAFHQHRIEPMFADWSRTDPGPEGLLALSHECSGLGGGCLALRRDTFQAVGGLCQELHVLDDVDLSFKVRHAGLRRVWVPGATAYDLVNRHKVAAVHRRERRAVGARWTAPLLDEYAPVFGAWHLERDRQELEAGAAFATA